MLDIIKKQLINLPNKVSEIQLSIGASHKMMEVKFIKPEERKNLKLIETEIGNIKKKLQDLEDRLLYGNLRLGGVIECENEWWIK